jgi:Flp pilus assembly protein TadB
MRWTLSGAGALLALRAVNENSDWEEFHEFRRTRQHEQLYGVPLDESWLELAERFQVN